MRDKIKSLAEAARLRARARAQGKTVVFTNGCFDILHAGHVDYLEAARAKGDLLIVGLNSDASMRRIKGGQRPLNPAADRAAVLAGLAAVDAVVEFGEDDPLALIESLVPDVLVKGADWGEGEIIGAEAVKAAGGKVERIELTAGRSTTELIRIIVERYGPKGP
ncbi:MAG TPA: D-glycero-beta-D-manno-heptose 1-phosphate adenylyltransferase [bacterium]|nr:D-glycero-beta-D-manno-heptose 1-phosphate adenylyltransferase [bacterium]